MNLRAGRAGWIVLAAVAIGAGIAVRRRFGSHASGRHATGGVLMPDAGAYDTHTRRLLNSLFRGIASDVAAATPDGARVLEVGCGPGHLSVRMARDYDLDVSGIDLDPAMIERARANAGRPPVQGRQPSFVVGDVAALPFDDASFDLVVSTFSMHHWSDPKAGLNEIARVVRLDGTVLVWDLKPAFGLFHGHAPDPAEQVRSTDLRLVTSKSWRWPWRISLAQRLELARH